MRGPRWKQTAIVITWDDYGGFYDSVPPPVERCANGEVFQPGFRLPALVISPYAKQGVVVHTATEQASVPRLVEELFALPFMSRRDPHARDGRAGSMLGALDFSRPPRAPLVLPVPDCR
jgi:phospholipase C